MKIIIETERLILREILITDEDGLFELDSDAEVHQYLGNKPIENIQQVRGIIKYIQKQYVDNGIGRYAVVQKDSNKFIGWCGLRFYREPINNHTNFYEIGYRFIKKYWGQGYATESAKAWINYGFEKMNLREIYGMTDINNLNSKKVLEKIGFKYIETFDYDGDPTDWFILRLLDFKKIKRSV